MIMLVQIDIGQGASAANQLESALHRVENILVFCVSFDTNIPSAQTQVQQGNVCLAILLGPKDHAISANRHTVIVRFQKVA